MLETELCSSRVFSPSREESGDEELSVLPRHTKVIVTGNNRTKSVLVGLQGVVKKAVGLGGWHWLVLKNGIEVKLQRNALSVLEPPTGNEEDDDYDFDYSSGCSDIGEKDNHRFSTDFHFGKLSNSRVRYSRPLSLAASVKSINHSICREVQSKCHASQLRVNLAKLGTGSLWRYQRRFNLVSASTNPTKEQLIRAVQRHFSSQQVDEIQVITEFVRAAKRLKSLDRR
ncbi:histone deacetylase complex subunit SAP30 SAP30 [Olea europaea subsp. europaea]|uniref:Histone deacetylase complex subunit SAP30 SAP30 n=1 Tax=Olea europaea subsp. europaea TaxID=158383 RepID=A0A8S0TE35_OLEEU|nr:histone deacetylase complex subunit SAP30 SAP30 [Olea europaea subsp. europaea]